MKIIWNKSGDCLEVQPISNEFCEYWVEQLIRHEENKLKFLSSTLDLKLLTDLKNHISVIDSLISNKLEIFDLSNFLNKDLLDQQVLNDLHRTWIKLHHKYPKLVTFISQVNDAYQFDWDQINKKLHFIELTVDASYISNKPNWEVENKFTHLLSFNIAQVQIVYSQQGRTSYNKWLNFDHNIEDSDTNNFFQVGGHVYLKATRPLELAPPKNYLEYCKVNNINPVGEYLNLGNFVNYEDQLTNIRQVIVRNIQDESNTISFEL